MNNPLAHNPYHDLKEQRVVYHNNGSPVKNDPAAQKAYMTALLTSLANHLKAVGCMIAQESPVKLDLRVICHGSGLDLFDIVRADEILQHRFAALCAQGVGFGVCANSLQMRDADWLKRNNITTAMIVPSGVAELAWLQLQGFAYIHL